MLETLWDILDPGFLAPGWLLAGLGVMAVLVALEIRTRRLRRQALRTFAAPHLLGSLVRSVSPIRRWVKSALLGAAAGLLCFALARPYLFYAWTDETRAGLDVLIAIDCSKSMLTEDVLPSRLERAQLAVTDFAEQLPDNRLGLLAFAGDSFLACPLTLDHQAFLDAVRGLDTDSIPKQGTDIGGAINAAVDSLRSQPLNRKYLILITDGEDLEGSAITAAENAAKAGLHIYTVGVGTANGGRIPERDDNGAIVFHHDVTGEEVISHLDEATLRRIADLTGGAYLPLGQDGAGLEQIYRQYLAPLASQSVEEKRQRIHLERFEWPLGMAILFLMAEFLLSDRARDPAVPALPARRQERRAAEATVAVLVVLLLGGSTLRATASDVAEAERAYRSGAYDAAMQAYEKAASRQPLHAELQFNRGDAAYKAGEYGEAEDAFRRALETRNLALQEQSYYNLGNAQFQHGAALVGVDPPRTIALWEAALHSYDAALHLSAAPDTQHNYDVVKRKLEELKQRQAQDKGSQESSSGGEGQQGNGSATNPTNSGPSEPSNRPSANSPTQPPDTAVTANEARTYSGTRPQDQNAPIIRSRQEAEYLLDSVKGDERHITARALHGNGPNEPPPSQKDW
jgi:Ca-activated chloride channel family protein